MMCAVGNVLGAGCGADGSVVLDGVEGAAWATVTVVDCTFLLWVAWLRGYSFGLGAGCE